MQKLAPENQTMFNPGAKSLLVLAVALGLQLSVSSSYASTYTCHDIVAASQFVANGQTWTSSQEAYAHDIKKEMAPLVVSMLETIRAEAEKGKQSARLYLHGLVNLGLGESLSIEDLALQVVHRVHLAEDRVNSLGFGFEECVYYGVGAYAGTGLKISDRS